MKKSLLILLTLAFVQLVVAQNRQIQPKEWYKTVQVEKPSPQVEPATFFEGETPIVSAALPPDVVIGETWYDLQTNGSLLPRMWVYPDGTMAATWTRGMTPTSYSDRGTGYNYYDGSAWGAYPTERIEPVRTGWPNYQPYGANGELVCAHTGNDAGLIFSWRENKGTGDWNYFYLVGPAGHEDLLWPRIITTGENHEIIHVFAITPPTGNDGTEYEGLNGAILYSRTTDGGITWEVENEILDGLSSDYSNGYSPDDYTWATPNGNTIAFVVNDGKNDGVIMKSADGGVNWERILFFEGPVPFIQVTDNLTAFGCSDGANAAVIDDNGKVHVVFGRAVQNVQDGVIFFYFYSDGLVYWNEDQPVLDTVKMGHEIIPEDWPNTYLALNGHLAANIQENDEGDTIVGVSTYFKSLTSMPQIVYHDGIIQVFFTMLAVGFDNTIFNYRHINGRFTEDEGATWSEYSDYTGDVFHLFSECIYPAAAPQVYDDKYHLIYQTSNQPGISIALSTAGADHDPINNNYVYLAISPVAVDIAENISTIADVSQNYPNPFNGKTYVNVNLTEGSDLMLEVYSITGQKLAENNFGYRNAGTQALTIDASNFTSGVYFYTIKANGQKVTQKMVVE
jgi:hypothetical protein